jgi:hypothetical protein
VIAIFSQRPVVELCASETVEQRQELGAGAAATVLFDGERAVQAGDQGTVCAPRPILLADGGKDAQANRSPQRPQFCNSRPAICRRQCPQHPM